MYLRLMPWAVRITNGSSPARRSSTSEFFLTFARWWFYAGWPVGRHYPNSLDGRGQQSNFLPRGGWVAEQAATVEKVSEKVSERQPITWLLPPIFELAPKQLLGVRGLATIGRWSISCIHPDASSQGPPTSRPVQVNFGNCRAGRFTVAFSANRVRDSTA